MRSKVWLAGITALLVLAGGAGCGDDEGGEAVPSAEALAADLLTVDDLAGDWTIAEPPDGQGPTSGVVPDELQDQLPSLELCDEASTEARAAAEALTWKAFRQLDLAVDDPIDLPADRTGHLVFVQEFLTSAEPDGLETTFDLLQQGMQQCLGELPAGEEGPGLAATMPVPELGDERIGVLATVEEAGGWAEWRLHEVVLRDGAVLLSLTIGDIRAGDTEPYYTVDEVGEMVEVAYRRLQGEGTSDVPVDTSTGIANPASAYCEAQGGRVEIVEESGGQVGYCLLPDGRRVEVWDYFRSSTTP